jgi:hydrogenase maturation protease
VRVLLAGVGNIFLGDDGFGVEVARRLAGRDLPAGVKVADFGTGGIHLAHEVLDGYDTLILIDAVALGAEPGSVAVLDVSPGAEDEATQAAPALDAHSLSPAAVLATVSKLGGRLRHAYMVGCQPASLEEGIGLSPPVRAALEKAVEACLELIGEVTGTANETKGRTPHVA